jgi:hypothetical protein
MFCLCCCRVLHAKDQKNFHSKQIENTSSCTSCLTHQCMEVLIFLVYYFRKLNMLSNGCVWTSRAVVGNQKVC